MRTAFIAVTERGGNLALKLSAKMQGDVFLKDGHALSGSFRSFASLKEWVREYFSVYEALVFIMAAGIVVRVLAPHLVHKSRDPAVVVMDERGKFAISLLSGHIGGANELARRLSSLCGACAVVTTATDVNKAAAADVLAKRLNMWPEDFRFLKYINGRLAAGEDVQFFIDRATSLKELYKRRFFAYMKECGAAYRLREVVAKALPQAESAVLITDKDAPSGERLLALTPRGVCAGIGCRRGVAKEKLLSSLYAACETAGIDLKEITCLASAAVKADEAGLLALAEELKLPVRFWPNHALRETIERYKLEKSPFVEKQIGVGNVCEAAALQMSRTKKILLPKTRLDKVTVALAWVR